VNDLSLVPDTTSLAPAAYAELVEINRSLTALLASVAPPSEPADARAGAFSRLLAGCGQSNDALVLGSPVCESRVVVVEHDTPRVQAQLGRVLGEQPRVVVAAVGARWAVFVPAFPRRTDVPAGRAAATATVRRAVSLAPDVRAGVSSELSEQADFTVALDEAVRASQLGAAGAFADDLWSAIGLARLREHAAASLTVDNPLRRLVENDGVLGPSVAAWLRADGDARSAAAQLGVHVNTLRYRLARAQEVSGLDLTDPDARLLARLVLL
jgi:DNA-binding PucR family transcriptional regulator